MREFILAVTLSCTIGGLSYATYQPPQKLYPDLSDIAVVPTIPALDWAIEYPVEASPVAQKQPPVTLSRLDRVRRYKGTNPTGWSSLWCAKFMAMVEPELAKKTKNPNLAMSWKELPKAQKQVGKIVVLTRSGGGHIGVISKVLPNGDLMVISGNHNHKVGEGLYSKRRIVAIVG